MRHVSRLSAQILKKLKLEAGAWDRRAAGEPQSDLLEELARAEVFRMRRPAREPVSVRLDPADVFLLRRVARRKGISHSQLLAQWVHERVLQETTSPARRRRAS